MDIYFQFSIKQYWGEKKCLFNKDLTVKNCLTLLQSALKKEKQFLVLFLLFKNLKLKNEYMQNIPDSQIKAKDLLCLESRQ